MSMVCVNSCDQGSCVSPKNDCRYRTSQIISTTYLPLYAALKPLCICVKRTFVKLSVATFMSSDQMIVSSTGPFSY